MAHTRDRGVTGMVKINGISVILFCFKTQISTWNNFLHQNRADNWHPYSGRALGCISWTAYPVIWLSPHWEVHALQVSKDMCQRVWLTEVPNWKLPCANQSKTGKEITACSHHRILYITKNEHPALAGVAQWIKWQPENQMVAGSSPGQGTCLGHRAGTQLRARKRHERHQSDVSLTHWCFSPTLSPSLTLSLKINKISTKKNRNKEQPTTTDTTTDEFHLLRASPHTGAHTRRLHSMWWES